MMLVRLALAIGLASVETAAFAKPPPRADAIGIGGMTSIRIDDPVFGGNAYVYEAGKEHARTVLLVHGIGMGGARDFTGQIGWLARSYHVVAVDLPGFGQSDKANHEYSPRRYAAFLEHVAGRFARGRVFLVGHSLGGLVSMMFASLHPNDVERLVVVDSPGILHPSVTAGNYLSRVDIPFLPAASKFPLAGLATKLLTHIDRAGFDPGGIVANEKLRGVVLSSSPSQIAALAAGIEDMSELLPRIEAETLVVWGGRDTVVPVRVGTILAQKIPRAELVVIDDAAHMPMRDTPASFRAAVEPFLAYGLAPPAQARPAVKPATHGDVVCHGKSQVLYEGEYDTLTLDECRAVRIRDARVGKLSVEHSTVTIQNSDIGGGAVGLEARSATVEMTGGRIAGDVAIMAFGSRFDLAGVDVDGGEAAIESPQASSVVFSMSRVRSERTDRGVHGIFTVSKEDPL